jgi:hypothetical protein
MNGGVLGTTPSGMNHAQAVCLKRAPQQLARDTPKTHSTWFSQLKAISNYLYLWARTMVE